MVPLLYNSRVTPRSKSRRLAAPYCWRTIYSSAEHRPELADIRATFGCDGKNARRTVRGRQERKMKQGVCNNSHQKDLTLCWYKQYVWPWFGRPPLNKNNFDRSGSLLRLPAACMFLAGSCYGCHSTLFYVQKSPPPPSSGTNGCAVTLLSPRPRTEKVPTAPRPTPLNEPQDCSAKRQRSSAACTRHCFIFHALNALCLHLDRASKGNYDGAAAEKKRWHPPRRGRSGGPRATV